LLLLLLLMLPPLLPPPLLVVVLQTALHTQQVTHQKQQQARCMRLCSGRQQGSLNMAVSRQQHQEQQRGQGLLMLLRVTCCSKKGVCIHMPRALLALLMMMSRTQV
jgi:hypothetical protein